MKKSLIFLLILITSITIYASDVILSNTLGAYYCAQEPNPKTYIKHTVEEPISIYWEDNVYTGFDEGDAKLMVTNYLDGVHLQTMALNTPDGKVRVYSYANINLNGNLLSEAGRYSDSTGTRSLAADIELTFDARITTVDTSLIPDYTVHPESINPSQTTRIRNSL